MVCAGVPCLCFNLVLIWNMDGVRHKQNCIVTKKKIIKEEMNTCQGNIKKCKMNKKNETIVSKIIVLIKSIANFAVKNAIKGQIKV